MLVLIDLLHVLLLLAGRKTTGERVDSNILRQASAGATLAMIADYNCFPTLLSVRKTIARCHLHVVGVGEG
jgi:hypothetical protein